MKFTKSQKLILSLMITSVVAQANAADAFMDKLVLQGLLKKEVEVKDVLTLMSNLAVVHAAAKDDDFKAADVKASELAEKVKTAAPTESVDDIVSNVGVVPKILRANLPAIGNDRTLVTEDIKTRAKFQFAQGVKQLTPETDATAAHILADASFDGHRHEIGIFSIVHAATNPGDPKVNYAGTAAVKPVYDRLVGFGIQNPTAEQIRYETAHHADPEEQRIAGARLVGLGFADPTPEQINYAADAAHRAEADAALITGVANERLVALGFAHPTAEQTAYAADAAHRVDADAALITGVANTRLAALGFAAPTVEQTAYAADAAHRAEADAALITGVANERLTALGFAHPTAEQAAYAADVAHRGEADAAFIPGIANARLVALGFVNPTVDQSAYAADVAHRGEADAAFIPGIANARLVALGFAHPTAEQIAYAADVAHRAEADAALITGVANERLAALGFAHPTAEQTAYAADVAHRADARAALITGVANTRLVALGFANPTPEQTAYAVALGHRAEADAALITGVANERLVALGFANPTAEQTAYAADAAHRAEANAALIDGVANARLVALGFAAPTVEQIAYAADAAHRADADAALVPGVANARLVTLGIAAPTADQTAYAVAHKGDTDADMLRRAQLTVDLGHQITNAEIAEDQRLTLLGQPLANRLPTADEIVVGVKLGNQSDYEEIEEGIRLRDVVHINFGDLTLNRVQASLMSNKPPVVTILQLDEIDRLFTNDVDLPQLTVDNAAMSLTLKVGAYAAGLTKDQFEEALLLKVRLGADPTSAQFAENMRLKATGHNNATADEIRIGILLGNACTIDHINEHVRLGDGGGEFPGAGASYQEVVESLRLSALIGGGAFATPQQIKEGVRLKGLPAIVRGNNLPDVSLPAPTLAEIAEGLRVPTANAQQVKEGARLQGLIDAEAVHGAPPVHPTDNQINAAIYISNKPALDPLNGGNLKQINAVVYLKPTAGGLVPAWLGGVGPIIADPSVADINATVQLTTQSVFGAPVFAAPRESQIKTVAGAFTDAMKAEAVWFFQTRNGDDNIPALAEIINITPEVAAVPGGAARVPAKYTLRIYHKDNTTNAFFVGNNAARNLIKGRRTNDAGVFVGHAHTVKDYRVVVSDLGIPHRNVGDAFKIGGLGLDNANADSVTIVDAIQHP